MNINPAIFRAYDIRGEVKKDLTPQVAEAVGKAFGTHIKSLGGAKVAMAQDNRRSSSYLAKDFSRGTLSTGINVIDLGLATTPMLYFAVITQNLSGGAVITGSHSKSNYNGIKLCKEKALHIFGEELQELRKLVVSETFSSGRGKLKKDDIFDAYESDILNRIGLKKRLKVAIDCSDGTTGAYAVHIFKRLGCDVVDYACNLENDFPHGSSDPSNSKNLFDLSKVVRENNCDVGLAFDSDGDRLGVVDERGNYVPIEAAAVIIAQQILRTSLRQRILRRPKKKFICDVKSLLGFPQLVTKWGGKVKMVPTGRTLFRQLLHDYPEIALGVEGSGHFYFNDRFYGYDDGIYAGARLLEIVSRSKKPLSRLARLFPKSFYTPTIEPHCPDDKKFAVVHGIGSRFKKEYDTIDVDGVRIRFDEQSWGLVRASDTGPNLSLRFEAPTRERLVEISKIVREELQKYPEVGDWELRLNQ